MKTYGDITITEWGELLEHVAERIRGQWGWLDVTIDGTWPSLRVETDGYTGRLTLEDGGQVSGRLEATANLASARTPHGTIQHARMMAHNLAAVCDAMIIAEGMVAEVRVWARDCPGAGADDKERAP